MTSCSSVPLFYHLGQLHIKLFEALKSKTFKLHFLLEHNVT